MKWTVYFIHSQHVLSHTGNLNTKILSDHKLGSLNCEPQWTLYPYNLSQVFPLYWKAILATTLQSSFIADISLNETQEETHWHVTEDPAAVDVGVMYWKNLSFEICWLNLEFWIYNTFYITVFIFHRNSDSKCYENENKLNTYIKLML